jgi:hypothetical protein
MQKILKVSSYKEYVDLPKRDRTVLGFWYIVPEALSLEDWNAVEVHFETEYPFQYRLREFIDSVSIQMYRFKYWWHENVVCRVKPRNKWVTKIIPHTWMDKPTLIEKLLFECIVHFVEVETVKYNHVDWKHERMVKIWTRIKTCYTYITVDLPNMQQEVSRLMKIAYPPDINTYTMVFPDQKDAQKEISVLEDIIANTTRDTLKEIIDLKPYLWT